jgi:hypothetical protein
MLHFAYKKFCRPNDTYGNVPHRGKMQLVFCIILPMSQFAYFFFLGKMTRIGQNAVRQYEPEFSSVIPRPPTTPPQPEFYFPFLPWTNAPFPHFFPTF